MWIKRIMTVASYDPLAVDCWLTVRPDLHNRNKEFGMQKDFSRKSFSEIQNYPTVSIENSIDAQEPVQLIDRITILLVCFSFVIPFFGFLFGLPYIWLILTRISHEHCVNFIKLYKFCYVTCNFFKAEIFTMFTKGQPISPRLFRR